jgi:hypothetical protein
MRTKSKTALEYGSGKISSCTCETIERKGFTQSEFNDNFLLASVKHWLWLWVSHLGHQFGAQLFNVGGRAFSPMPSGNKQKEGFGGID